MTTNCNKQWQVIRDKDVFSSLDNECTVKMIVKIKNFMYFERRIPLQNNSIIITYLITVLYRSLIPIVSMCLI